MYYSNSASQPDSTFVDPQPKLYFGITPGLRFGYPIRLRFGSNLVTIWLQVVLPSYPSPVTTISRYFSYNLVMSTYTPLLLLLYLLVTP